MVAGIGPVRVTLGGQFLDTGKDPADETSISSRTLCGGDAARGCLTQPQKISDLWEIESFMSTYADDLRRGDVVLIDAGYFSSGCHIGIFSFTIHATSAYRTSRVDEIIPALCASHLGIVRRPRCARPEELFPHMASGKCPG